VTPEMLRVAATAYRQPVGKAGVILAHLSKSCIFK